MGEFANETRGLIPEFGPDPSNRRFLGLMSRKVHEDQGHYNHPYGPSNLNPGYEWDGYAHNPQHYKGFAVATGGSLTQYRDGGWEQTDSGVVAGPLGDPSRRIFAERLARRKGVM